MTKLAQVFSQTFRSFTPEALSERLFSVSLERWWQKHQQALESSGYDGVVQVAFFITTFSSMGHVAKCDGRIRDTEVQMAAKVMKHLKLNAEQKRLAIRLFNDGKHSDFDLDSLLWRFYRQSRHRVSVLQIFIEMQLQMAYADGQMNDTERKLIMHMCKRLEVSESILSRIERRVRDDKSNTGSPARKPTTAAASRQQKISLKQAKSMFNLGCRATTQEIKQAYRKLLSQHHPDKLISRGASETEINQAQQLLQRIKQAYETLICARRVE